jgi:hypothetical protein
VTGPKDEKGKIDSLDPVLAGRKLGCGAEAPTLQGLCRSKIR